MYTPTVAELRSALANAHGMSLIRDEVDVLGLLREANPAWSVSSKRLHRLLAGEPHPPPSPPCPPDNTIWDGIIIHPDIHGVDPFLSVETLRDHLDLCTVAFDEDGAVEGSCMKDLLDASESRHLLSLYDRDSAEYGWYYRVYGAGEAKGKPQNSIATSLTTSRVSGRLLVILDGPKDGKWQTSVHVDVERFARTVWWYRHSGNDVAEVFGERELRRFLSAL